MAESPQCSSPAEPMTQISIPNTEETQITNTEQINTAKPDEESYNPDKLFHCCECGLDVGTKKELIQHFREHPGVRRCRCNVCHKVYNTGAKLHLHINSHLGRKDFTCDICGKSFARKSGLRRHYARSHFMNKPHTFIVGGTSNPAELEKHLIVSEPYCPPTETNLFEHTEIQIESILQ